MSENPMTRRTLLASGATGAVAGLLASGPAPAAAAEPPPNVYEQLGITPIINAAGTITTLGGSLMPPEVIAAWNAASKHFVPLDDLQIKVGERIAKLLNVEAALVTTGAAGA